VAASTTTGLIAETNQDEGVLGFASAQQREHIPHLSKMLTTITMQGTRHTKVRDVELNRY